MHKEVSAAVLRSYEAEAFARVEPFDGTFTFGLFLLGHDRGGGGRQGTTGTPSA
jgi:hypothetical protein